MKCLTWLKEWNQRGCQAFSSDTTEQQALDWLRENQGLGKKGEVKTLHHIISYRFTSLSN